MTMEVEILSKEIIKPSSPTPPDLQRFNISLLDQLATAGYVPVILFFANDGGRAPSFEERSGRLKKSLAETLTRFYPLAGRPRENSYIDCNDDGAEYVEARANCNLSDFLKEPTPELLADFLPVRTEAPEAADGGRMFLVQVTLFECGGMAMGVSFSHKLVDASSVSVILKSWSAAALGSDMTSETEFLQASLVPPPEGIPIAIPPTDLGGKVKCASRRLVFNGPKIASLKSAAASETVRNPSRVEAITALIWKCAMKSATKTTSSNPPTLSLMSQTVNLRKRLTPPSSEYSIGNLIGNFASKVNLPATGDQTGLQRLVELSRDGIAEFNKIGINKYEGKDAFSKIFKGLQELGGLFMRDDVAFYISSSWTRFGLYEMDFGWGKPVWVSIGSIMFVNFVVLMDTKDGEGIEAWVTLKEDEMASFEQDDELLAFASVNPSVVS